MKQVLKFSILLLIFINFSYIVCEKNEVDDDEVEQSGVKAGSNKNLPESDNEDSLGESENKNSKQMVPSKNNKHANSMNGSQTTTNSRKQKIAKHTKKTLKKGVTKASGFGHKAKLTLNKMHQKMKESQNNRTRASKDTMYEY